MQRTFCAFLLLGLAVSVLAAAFFPLPHHQRYRSSIGVLANGGRQEDFSIEWPRDRVHMTAQGAANLLLDAGGVAVLPGAAGATASAEVFRLRDASGNVIGLASRTTTTGPGGEHPTGPQGTDWMLLVPSRGALFLHQTNGIDVAPRVPATGRQLVAAQDAPGFWSKATRYRITGGPRADGAGEVVRGTEEFATLQGTYEEIWELAEVAADGATRGRITLSTRTMAQR